MSWFYEALTRAQKERSKPGQESGVSVTDQEGEAFLAAIESASSIAERSTLGAERWASAPVSVAEDAPPASEETARGEGQVRSQPSPEIESRNGYRHLNLPVQEDSRLIFHTNSHGLAAEQFRLLRRTLSQDFSEGGVLMVTSPGVGDGKTLTTLNLCACMANSGDSTLLVEADVRRPTVRKILGCAIEPPGIEDALAGKVEPSRAIHLVEELSLHAAMVMELPRDPSHLITGPDVKRFLMWARAHFRWVVLDAAPVLPAADVAELLPLADAVLLVVRVQNTPRELSRRAFEMLGKRLHGVILNEATIDTNPYYRYLSNYYAGSTVKDN